MRDRNAEFHSEQHRQQIGRHARGVEVVDFFNLLTGPELIEVTESHLPEHRERLYPPTVTLSMFMRQALDADGSCQKAVNGWAAQRHAEGLSVQSVRTGAYCKARERLPMSMVTGLTLAVGQLVSARAKAGWRWRGRRVKLVDGTGISMPDTLENQGAYPQPSSQADGVGFPLARVVGVICLATGAVIDAAIGPHAGKGSSELGLLRTLGASTRAMADNWFILDGAEPPGAEKVKVFGLIQPTYEYDMSQHAYGLAGSEVGNDGKYPLYSTIAPSYKSTSSFYVFRMRLGARGALSRDINYEAVAELGVNALTTQPGGSYTPQLAEGSITFNEIPGARFRVGLFKTPGSEEGLRTAIDYVEFTNLTSQFLNYQPVTAINGVPDSNGGYSANTSSGVRAFRDTGIEAFDAFQFGQWEYTYAVMVGNGSALNSVDENSGKGIYGRLQISYLFDRGTNAFSKGRNDATLFIWAHSGTQTFNGGNYPARRQGVGVVVVRHPYDFTAEYANGSGMVLLTPLFPGGTFDVFPGSQNKADGWYVEGGYFVTNAVKLDLRYDVFDQLTNVRPLTRKYKTLTLGVLYYLEKDARVAFNYEFRDLAFPGVEPSDGATFANESAVAHAVGNRVGVQATVVF